MVNFAEWVDKELALRDWTRADLSQRAKISQSTLSMIYSQSRKAGPDVCNAIAAALKVPPDEVFRAAGLLPPVPSADDTLKRIEYLYNTLEDPDNKQRALEYIESLITREEKGKYSATKNSATQPR